MHHTSALQDLDVATSRKCSTGLSLPGLLLFVHIKQDLLRFFSRLSRKQFRT